MSADSMIAARNDATLNHKPQLNSNNKQNPAFSVPMVKRKSPLSKGFAQVYAKNYSFTRQNPNFPSSR